MSTVPPSATSRPNTLAELFASWGPDHTISPHEPRAFNKLASRYSDLLQLVHRLEDAPGSAGRAGSHLDMAKAPGPSPQYNVVEGCAMMPGPFTSPSETAPYLHPVLSAQRGTPGYEAEKAALSSIEPRIAAALHACEGLDTADLAGNNKGWLSEVVHDAARVESELNNALRACCPGNGDEPDPVRCQLYEASEQGSPCPRGCCSMAEEKDVRALLAAIEVEEETAPSAIEPLSREALKFARDYVGGSYVPGGSPGLLSIAEELLRIEALLHRADDTGEKNG